MEGANERANELFRQKKLSYLGISKVIVSGNLQGEKGGGCGAAGR
jgi:hypothetical protein